jgi:hypothetical protein
MAPRYSLARKRAIELLRTSNKTPLSIHEVSKTVAGHAGVLKTLFAG